jgi:hypothetical protein
MEKIYTVHYVIDTYGETANYRTVNMAEVIDRYEMLTERIKGALLSNHVENPEQLITYSFRMLGDQRGDRYLRKELVDVNLDALKEDLTGFPWENWPWVQAFQPVVDVAGYSIVELEKELQSFGPSMSKSSDHVAPCYRIYENGRGDYRKTPFTDTPKKKPEPAPAENDSWYKRFKDNYLVPFGDVIVENAPTILAVTTTIAAVAVMMHTSNESVHVVEEATRKNEELLRHIEETIEDAVELPQIVKVELGDDIEVVATGHRTW